jgi:hypothetical protein
VDQGVPLITDLQLSRAFIEALRWKRPEDLGVVAMDTYLARSSSGLMQALSPNT